jgi:hypothetical protein
VNAIDRERLDALTAEVGELRSRFGCIRCQTPPPPPPRWPGDPWSTDMRPAHTCHQGSA